MEHQGQAVRVPAPGGHDLMPSVALRTDGLTKRYGQRVVVNGVSLAVRRGEVYGFLGPNGAGKTTTMRMIVGLVKPTAGSVEVLGKPPGDPNALARIGAMVEAATFYPYLSGRENLEVLAWHARVPRRRIDAVLETVGLSGRAGDRFGRYSLGMKQRLGVAGALLKEPELLILDEPTNGLDPLGMADMRGLIRRLGDAGKAVLLSSHNLGEVQEVCDRVGVIFKGRLVAQTTVAELRGSASLVIRATPLDQAQRLLAHLLGSGALSVERDQIHLDVSPDRAAWINRQLMVASVDVHELRREERSLEEAFMAMSADYGEGGSNVG